MMRPKYIIAGISQFNLILLCLSLENLGENCNLKSGDSGICKLFPDCPPAREDLKQGMQPISCGFDGIVPIVCCPSQVSSTTENLPNRDNIRKVSGENCNLRSGESGICKLFPDCQPAQEDLKQRIQPISCGFDGIVPIVCCPSQVSSTTENLPVIDNLRKVSGETATFWCGKYLEICDNERDIAGISFLRSRSQRDISPTEVPPNLEFGNGTVGGEDANIGEFPHMAAIGYGNESSIKWLCGGTLISENFVLTAAHCLSSRNYGPAQWIRLGASELHDELRSASANASRGQTHRVMRRIRHPGYRPPSKYHDVALIEIGPTLESNPFSLMSKTIHPACLQVNNETNMTHAVATGWGRLGHYDDVSAILQKVELRILDKSICNDTYEYEIKWSNALKRGMDESVICAGELSGGKDTCLGDSGGPLQISLSADKCKYRVVAITSFGKVCGFKNSPGVYMSVSHYIPWIESIVWNYP